MKNEENKYQVNHHSTMAKSSSLNFALKSTGITHPKFLISNLTKAQKPSHTLFCQSEEGNPSSTLTVGNKEEKVTNKIGDNLFPVPHPQSLPLILLFTKHNCQKPQ